MPQKIWPADQREGLKGAHGEHRSERKGSISGEWELVMFASRSFSNLSDVKTRARKVTCRGALAPRRSTSFHGMHTIVLHTDSDGCHRVTHVRTSGRHLSPMGQDGLTPRSEASATSMEEWGVVEAALQNYQWGKLSDDLEKSIERAPHLKTGH